MSSVTSTFFSEVAPQITPPSRLDSVLASWQMKQLHVIGDGNCCFSAVAQGLINLSSSVQLDSFHQSLTSSCLETVSKQLRCIAVEEWTQHADYYSGFLIDCNVVEEAQKFLNPGTFNCDLGDTVLLSLANALSIQFIVFTTMEYHPVIHVSPGCIKSGCTIYLAYTHTGCGHYDSVIDNDTSDEQPVVSQTKNEMCTCGKNTTGGEGSHCVPVMSKYTTTIRCTCLRNGKPCTMLCWCRDCGNEHGKRPKPSTPARKRRKYMHQIDIPKSVQFGINAGEQMSTGKRTILEFFVLEEIIKNQHLEVTDDALLNLYSAIVEVANSFGTTLPMGNKDKENIRTFLREHQHNLEAFSALCCSQLCMNQT